jgi:hypothetical protein
VVQGDNSITIATARDNYLIAYLTFEQPWEPPNS